MAQNQSSEALRRPLGALRMSFPVVILGSLVLGYLGFAELLPAHPDVDQRPIDLVYYSLQLFVLGPNPLQVVHPPYPMILEIARFSAPAATVYALIEATRMLFSVELSRWKARTSRGKSDRSHVVL